MNVLAIECSSREGSVAVLQGGTVLHSAHFPSPRGRGGEIFTRLESALREMPRTDLVIVGTGPGSYNGLRTSIAAAWGTARARGARLVGVSSLLGYDVPEYFVVGDARANQRFLAHVVEGAFVFSPVLLTPREAREKLLPGLPVFATSELEDLPEATVAAPRAEILARRKFPEGFPEPTYLKPPHITTPAGSAKPTQLPVRSS